MNDALKYLLGLLFESMFLGEINNHLRYSANDKGPKEVKIEEIAILKKTSQREIELSRDRYALFEPVFIPKRKSISYVCKKYVSKR